MAPKIAKLPTGHHTIAFLEKRLNTVFKKDCETRINAEKNESVGALVIYNLEETDVRLDQNFQKFLGIDSKLGIRTYMKRLNSPSSYCIHCDLMNKTENLLNGKPSNPLAKFQIRGNPFEKIDCIKPPQHCVTLITGVNICIV